MTESLDLVVSLAQSRSLSEAHGIVQRLTQDHGFTWRPLGDRENNYGQINIGSDPGTAFIERVTNAIDAVVEYQALSRGVSGGEKGNPTRPREATESWIGIPSGRIRNLPLTRRQELADQIRVIIHPGQEPDTPTIEVRDHGVGLRPRQFPSTIMDLGGSNKIDKPYLAGAYGQGGSTALAFSPGGALFVSRRQPSLLEQEEEDLVAVTFARFRDLDPAINKNGRYEYLVQADSTVAAIPGRAMDKFDPGTSVTHFNLEIADYARKLTQLTGSFWWLLQNSLFDPVLPFWAEEHRPEMIDERPIRRSIAGNHSRLWTDENDRIEHADSVIVPIDDPETGGSVRVYYWVVKERESESRGRPIDAYVDPYRPVAYTYFGQTHGTEDRRFIADRLNFTYLTNYLILHIELDDISPTLRRKLLSSTRDRLKSSSIYEEMRERIAVALSEDEALIRINDARKEDILSRHSESERKELQKKLARLMESLEAGTGAPAGGKSGDETGREQSKGGETDGFEPLPTRDEPTFLRIANVQRPIPVQKRRRALLRLESDAPDGYMARNADVTLMLSGEPKGTLYVDSVSDFRGGRSRMLVKPAETADVGRDGQLVVRLVTGNGSEFAASAPFEVVEPRERKTMDSSGRAEVATPEPIAIKKEQWDEFGWDEGSVAEVHADREVPRIYVNVHNRHIRRLLREGGYQERGMKRMQNNYLLYVAYFAWLQHHGLQDSEVELSGRDFEEYRQSELDRAARTVIHSISAVGRL